MTKAFYWSAIAFAAIQISAANADGGDFFDGFKNISVAKSGTEQWTRATFLVNASVVSASLPSGLELNPAAVTADGKYPIILMVGQRTNFQISFNSFVAVKNAQENLALGIVPVRRTGGTKIYDFHLNLLENLPIGVFVDRKILGLAAHMAILDMNGTKRFCDVGDDDDGHDNHDHGRGDPRISLVVDPVIPPFDQAVFNQKLQAGFGTPAAIIGVRDGRLVCSTKAYDAATLTGMPVKTQWTINDAFAPGLAGQYDSSNAVGGISISFQGNFTAGGPVPCDP